ncbi:MAG TPA: hypothetical protein VHE55_17145 [Fimbriimonadaceae bacterium]|nr:hypothetical protein [Fimbriimonadaceae bacterium]
MDNLNLQSFDRRVRLVRSWKGLAIGASFGSLTAVVWAGLDWANVVYADWSGLGLVVVAGAIVGALAGLFLKVSPKSLADSIDRRADLEDRLTTSIERGDSHTGFDDDLHADARAHLAGLKPAKLYPVRVGKWHAAALAGAALASGIFLLGNTSIMLSDQQKKDREVVKEAGQIVQRVLKPVEEDMKAAEPSAQEQRLAEELRKLAREMEKARLTKEEAMQKSNELQKQAQELTKNKAQSAEDSLAKAETALQKLERQEMEKGGAETDQNDSQMSQQERDAKASETLKQANSLQRQMNALQQQMSQIQSQMHRSDTSQAERQELDKELQKLLNQQKALQRQLQSLHLSKEVQDMLRRMMENPLYKQIQELAQKMAEAAKSAKENPDQPPALSKEQLEEMEKKLEELAKQLKGDKAMEEYLKALMEAMKNMKESGNGQKLGVGLGLGLSGMSQMGGMNGLNSNMYDPNAGPGAPSRDTYFANVDKVHHSDKADPSKGTTSLTAIRGERDDTKPGGAYMEIKGPTMVGNRSSVAYTRDVLSAKKKAEQAIDRQKIPKEHEKRVKAYFDSLTKG